MFMKVSSLASLIHGDRFMSTDVALPFRQDIIGHNLCSNVAKYPDGQAVLQAQEVARFMSAIDQKYFFEMEYDGLPIWGDIGFMEGPKHYLYTRYNFGISYHQEKIIAVNVTMSHPIQLLALASDEHMPVMFSYSARWFHTDKNPIDRTELYTSSMRSTTESIHWVALVNSICITSLGVVILWAIMMRVLKKDTKKRLSHDSIDELGWKSISGDVFRPPAQKMYLASSIGVGAQLLVALVAFLILGLWGLISKDEGDRTITMLIVYVLTAFIAGYVATKVFIGLEGKKYATNLLVASLLFTLPLFLIVAFGNFVAVGFSSTAALPLAAVIKLVLILGLTAVPLSIAGGIVAKSRSKKFEAPTRTYSYKKEIPEVNFYQRPWFQFMVAGFIPFAASYMEIIQFFSSNLNQAGLMFGLLVLILLTIIVVTACVAAIFTFFQLSSGDYNWWLWSFGYGGSAAVWLVLYSLFYWAVQSNLRGFMQFWHFFGTVLVCAWGVWLILGTIGFLTSYFLVKKMYSAIKAD
ncbi:hypothetical protein PCE1_003795 [Barthelona sp. PCE]